MIGEMFKLPPLEMLKLLSLSQKEQRLPLKHLLFSMEMSLSNTLSPI
jgi:hypothetical protein